VCVPVMTSWLPAPAGAGDTEVAGESAVQVAATPTGDSPQVASAVAASANTADVDETSFAAARRPGAGVSAPLRPAGQGSPRPRYHRQPPGAVDGPSRCRTGATATCTT
jgi:hypothetical protein